MKYKCSPQSGLRNVKLKERNQQGKKFQSTQWRKPIAEFKTKPRSSKKIEENKTEENHEQEHGADQPVSRVWFSNFDESVHRLLNIFNWVHTDHGTTAF